MLRYSRMGSVTPSTGAGRGESKEARGGGAGSCQTVSGSQSKNLLTHDNLVLHEHMA
jgi:hypothetical protein